MPNGTAYWKIEGQPKGKRKRYYFQTEGEAKKAAEHRNNQLISFGAREVMPESDRLMALECIRMAREYGKSLYDATHFACSVWGRQETSITVEELCNRVVAYYDNLLSEDPSTSGNVAYMKYVARKFVAGGAKDKVTGLLSRRTQCRDRCCQHRVGNDPRGLPKLL